MRSAPLRILLVAPSYFPAIYWGGPVYSIYGLCNALAMIPGVNLRVLTTDSAGPELSDSVPVKGFPMRYPPGYEVYFCRRRWGASFSPELILRLWVMIRWADVIQLTAVYSSPTIPTLLFARLLGKQVVWSPLGALQRWEGATRPAAKAVWERVCNALIAPGACVLHVTSLEEAEESSARITKATVERIPHGVEFPESLLERAWLPGGALRLLFIGRLHPKKGIENLFKALKELNDAAISLAVCGTGDEAYARGLRQLARDLGLERQVSFLGHVDGEAKMKVFMSADACVVPSFTENFGMVVVEALAHGVPVVASHGTPWAELVERQCGLWVENDPESLKKAILALRGRDLADMGARGRNWMKREFSWDAISQKMLCVYRRMARADGAAGTL